MLLTPLTGQTSRRQGGWLVLTTAWRGAAGGRPGQRQRIKSNSSSYPHFHVVLLTSRRPHLLHELDSRLACTFCSHRLSPPSGGHGATEVSALAQLRPCGIPH